MRPFTGFAPSRAAPGAPPVPAGTAAGAATESPRRPARPAAIARDPPLVREFSRFPARAPDPRKSPGAP